MPAGVSVSPELVPSVALLGTFDAPDYGELLAARVVERELSRRLPFARVDWYAPLGRRRPLAIDPGRPALPLGPPEPARKAQLAAGHDLVVFSGPTVHTRDDLYGQLYGIPADEAERLRPSGFFVDGLGAELERRHQCRVAWHAVGVPLDLDAAGAARVRAALGSAGHVSVRDERSRERLLAAGVEAEITVMPHPAVLADRLFAADVLRKRLDYLRTMGWYPGESPPILVQSDDGVADAASEIARHAGDLGAPVAVVALGGQHGPDDVADAIAPLLPAAPFRLPAELTLEDVTAAIAHAGAFVGTSAAADAVARAFRVPSHARTDVAELQRRVDGELDVLAALAEEGWSARATADGRSVSELSRALDHADERYRALLRAYEERGERLLRDRLRYAEIVDGLEAAAGGLAGDAVSRQSELETRLEMAAAAEAEARFELEQLRARQRA